MLFRSRRGHRGDNRSNVERKGRQTTAAIGTRASDIRVEKLKPLKIPVLPDIQETPNEIKKIQEEDTTLKRHLEMTHVKEKLQEAYTCMLELKERIEETCKMAQSVIREANAENKKYYDRKEEILENDGTLNTETVAFVSAVVYDGEFREYGEEEILELYNSEQTESYKDVNVNPDLNPKQKKELLQLLENYKDIFSDVPGETDLVKHEIKLTSVEPTRAKA